MENLKDKVSDLTVVIIMALTIMMLISIIGISCGFIIFGVIFKYCLVGLLINLFLTVLCI
jgi:hypothetical protein